MSCLFFFFLFFFSLFLCFRYSIYNFSTDWIHRNTLSHTDKQMPNIHIHIHVAHVNCEYECEWDTFKCIPSLFFILHAHLVWFGLVSSSFAFFFFFPFFFFFFECLYHLKTQLQANTSRFLCCLSLRTFYFFYFLHCKHFESIEHFDLIFLEKIFPLVTCFVFIFHKLTERQILEFGIFRNFRLSPKSNSFFLQFAGSVFIQNFKCGWSRVIENCKT